MSEMTILEALQTDQVKGILEAKIQEAVDGLDLSDAVAGAVTEALSDLDEKVKSVVEAALPTLLTGVQEQVTATVTAGNEMRTLHLDARSLIEASALKGAARQNLLDDYGLSEDDSGKVTPGRALRLIEAEVDGDGAVTKTSKVVLRETVEADIKRARLALRESPAAATVPVAPGGGGGGAAPAGEPDWVKRIRQQGGDPANFGYNPPKAA